MQKINWQEWTKETFQKAAKEKKPILLDIHGVWCHWCHVMDQTSYSDPEVIEIVNKDFIPIKVDTDKNPDVNKRYNQGGWPSTVFLTPTGQIITGATYVPPDSLKDMMFKVIDTFKEIKFKDVILEDKKLKVDNNVKLNNKIIENIMEDMLNKFDFDFGGFGTPKFPMTDAIQLAFNQYNKSKNKDYLIIARVTLDKMKGILDDIEGGFYRYSVTRQWNEPHYEKMMETNAGIIANYLQGYEIMKKDEYREIAQKSLNYIKNNLSNENGAFYGSQDADEEYYPKNLEERKKHGKPFIDKNIYTDLSSMMISTYTYAYKILKDNFYKNFAIKSIKFLIDKNYTRKQVSGTNFVGDEKFGMYHFFDGKRKFLPGMLADNIYFIKALIDVYEITEDKQYLKAAEKLNKFVIDNFMDKNDNCFFDKINNPDGIGFLKFRDKSIIENSIVAINLLKLNKNNEYIKIAENILKAFYSEYEKQGIHGTIYGLAVERYLNVQSPF